MRNHSSSDNRIMRLRDVSLGTIIRYQLDYEPVIDPNGPFGKSEQHEWIVVAKNHPGYPENTVTLLSRIAVDVCPYDHPETHRPGHTVGQGASDWESSNLRQLLNNFDNRKISYPYDVFPNTWRVSSSTSVPVIGGEGGVTLLKGFYKRRLSEMTRLGYGPNEMRPIPTTLRYRNWEGKVKVVTDTVFIPSAIEMNLIQSRSSLAHPYELFRSSKLRNTRSSTTINGLGSDDAFWLRPDGYITDATTVNIAYASNGSPGSSYYTLTARSPSSWSRVMVCINISADTLIKYTSSNKYEVVYGNLLRESAIVDSHARYDPELYGFTGTPGTAYYCGINGVSSGDAFTYSGADGDIYADDVPISESQKFEFRSFYPYISEMNGGQAVSMLAYTPLSTVYKPYMLSTSADGFTSRPKLTSYTKSEVNTFRDIYGGGRNKSIESSDAPIVSPTQSMSVITSGEAVFESIDNPKFAVGPLMPREKLMFDNPTIVLGSPETQRIYRTPLVISQNRIFNLDSGQLMYTLNIPYSDIIQVAASPDSDRIYIRRRKSGRSNGVIEIHSVSFTSVSVSVRYVKEISIPSDILELIMYPSYDGICTMTYKHRNYSPQRRVYYTYWDTVASSTPSFDTSRWADMHYSHDGELVTTWIWYIRKLSGYLIRTVSDFIFVPGSKTGSITLIEDTRRLGSDVIGFMPPAGLLGGFLNIPNFNIRDFPIWFDWDNRKMHILLLGIVEFVRVSVTLRPESGGVFSIMPNTMEHELLKDRYRFDINGREYDSPIKPLEAKKFAHNGTTVVTKGMNQVISNDGAAGSVMWPEPKGLAHVTAGMQAYGGNGVAYREMTFIAQVTKNPYNRVRYWFSPYVHDTAGFDNHALMAVMPSLVSKHTRLGFTRMHNIGAVGFFLTNNKYRMRTPRFKLYDQAAAIYKNELGNYQMWDKRNTFEGYEKASYVFWSGYSASNSSAIDSIKIYNEYITRHSTCIVTITPGSDELIKDEMKKIEFFEDVLEHDGFVEVFFKLTNKGIPNMDNILAVLRFDIDIEYHN